MLHNLYTAFIFLYVYYLFFFFFRLKHIIFALGSRGRNIEKYVQINTATIFIVRGGAAVKDFKHINHKI